MDSDGVRVPLRLRWRQVLLAGLSSALLLAYVGRSLGWTGRPVYAVLFLAMLVSDKWPQVTLTPEAAVVRKFRRRVIPWTSVRDITVDRRNGARSIVLLEAHRVTRLRAPTTGFLWVRDSQFYAKHAFIVQWWLAHGGERSISPGGQSVWVAPRRAVPELVVPSRAWPTVALTGLLMVADAAVVALAMWAGRGWTNLDPITFAVGDVPATEVAVVGAVIAGLGAGIVLSILARRRVVPADAELRCRSVSSHAGVLAAAAGALGAAIVVTPVAWFGIAPLLAPAYFVAATLALGVACLTAAVWVRRLEASGRRLAVATAGPFWLPPPLGNATMLGPGVGVGA